MSESVPVSVAERDRTRKSSLTVVVPSEGVQYTRTINYMFMIEANVPRDLCSDRPYGTLRRVAKGPNHVQPFKLARGEEGALGDDGVALWQMNIGRMGEQTMFAAVDADEAGLGLDELLRDTPDCVILVSPEDAEALSQTEVVDLQVIHFQGALATSG